MIKHIMRGMLEAELKEICDKPLVMTILFYLEIFSFVSTGFALARQWFFLGAVLFLIGLLLAFTVGEALTIKGKLKAEKKDMEGFLNIAW